MAQKRRFENEQDGDEMVIDDDELNKIIKVQESNEFADSDKQREKYIVSQMFSKNVIDEK